MDVQLSTGFIVHIEHEGELDLEPLFDAILVEHLVKRAGSGIAPELALQREIEHLIATAPSATKDALLLQLLSAAFHRHWREYVRAAAG